MGLFDKLNSDGRDEQAREKIHRNQEVSLPCTHAEAIERVETSIRERYDVTHIEAVKAHRYSRHWNVDVYAVVWESGDGG